MNDDTKEPQYFVTITRQSEGNPSTDYHVLYEKTEVSYPLPICTEYVRRRTESFPFAKPQEVYLTQDQGVVWNALRSWFRWETSGRRVTNSYVIGVLQSPPKVEHAKWTWDRPKKWYISFGMGPYGLYPNPLLSFMKKAET